MNGFITVMDDILGNISMFSKSITHIHCKLSDDGKLIAKAPSVDRSVSVEVESKHDVPELTGLACLGNLPYLGKIISSSLMKDAEIDMDFRVNTHNSRNLLHSIIFDGDGAAISYRAVNPFVGDIIMPKKLGISTYPVGFDVTPDIIEKFKQVKSIYALSPKSGSQRDEWLEIIHNSGTVLGFLGTEQNQTSFLLGTTGDESSHPTSGYFMADHFSRLLDVGKKTGLSVKLSDKALKVEYDTDLAHYQIILAGKIVKDMN